MKSYRSWGGYPQLSSQIPYPIYWVSDPIPFQQLPGMVLPYGCGRSYGDSCQNDHGTLLDTAPLNHFISFDDRSGILRCEAGVTFDEILKVIVPRGWFLPVSPGTKFISVGGAIANDIHGKNHHQDGTFGRHVLQFELVRSTGERLLCSPAENPDFYAATIGGLGLTGIITWAEFQLIPVFNPLMAVETIPLKSLDEFFRIEEESNKNYQYTVSWLDSQNQRGGVCRGLLIRANHATLPASNYQHPSSLRLKIPINLPHLIFNRLTVKALNALYYHIVSGVARNRTTHYDRFFYPLDRVGHCNRLYGKRGFVQYHCVVEDTKDHEAIRILLKSISQSKLTSFLTILKRFGNRPSPGLLSFPKEGISLAIDFPFQGDKTLALLEQLDQIVIEHRGRIYPAKDARMSAESFRTFYPNWQKFAEYVDPKFSSSLWRRVTCTKS